MKKNTAISIVSGFLVLALVVVAALAIAGVFNVKNNPIDTIALADDDPAVAEQQLFRGFAEDTVLYVKSVDGSKVTGSVDSILRVRNNNGAVKMISNVSADEAGNPGFKPQDGWTAGMYYNVNLASGYVFVNEQYAGLDGFECIVASRESVESDTKLSDNVVYLQKGAFSVSAIPGTSYYTLQSSGSYDEAIATPVFVVVDGLDSQSYRLVQDAQVVKTADGFKATVEAAEIDDVYDELYISKSFELGDGVGFEIDAEATEASIRSCDWFVAAVDYLYGESLDDNQNNKKWIDFKVDPSFEAGSPSKIKVNISIVFKGITKNSKGERDEDSQIKVLINNVLTPVFDVHIQKEEDSKGFDANMALDIETTAGVTFSYSKDVTSYGKDADESMEAIANKVAALVKKVVADKYDNSSKPYTFAKWIIPIGTLPICIEDAMGIELGANFSGQVNVTASNAFHVEVGVVYADGDLKGYGNVDDQFHFDGITLAGSAGAKVGLVNEIGISAYGVISVDLGLHAGVYADLAGRLELDGDDIIKLFTGAQGLNIIPAYYFEAGIYVDLTAAGKVFGFTLKQFTLLSKKFPLFTAGHKYLPVEGVDNPFVDETIYMESSYYYITNWDVNALDIQNIASAATLRTLSYDEFDYTLGEGLRMDGNKLIATKAGEYETYFVVTSKVNKKLSKTVTVIKNPEIPTATVTEKVYDKNGAKKNVIYNVLLNGSKLIDVKVDGASFSYTYEDGDLVLPAEKVGKLGYGAHTVVVESSKGYLNLVLRVINSAAVEVDTSAAQYDKAAAAALQWDMQLQGNDVLTVKEGGQVVSSKYYTYRDSDGKFIFSAAYWDAKDCGDYVEEVSLSDGSTFQLNVRVQDSRSTKLLTNVYSYVFGSNEDLALAVELYSNAVESLIFDNTIINTAEAVIGADYFDGKAAGEYEGSINGQSFSVVITKANNALVIPVQTATYYKSINEDVVFQVKKMAQNVIISGCADAIIGSDSITIPASFLAAQNGSQWTGAVVGADNSVTLTVELINDVLPSIKASSIDLVGNEAKEVAWDLQDYTLADVYVDGLATANYTKTFSGLTIKGADLAYGAVQATIYTPVNELVLTINHSGTPTIAPNYALNKQSNEAQVVSYALDTAHLGFDYVTVDGADILPIQYRYSEGLLTLSNDFAYGLNAGSYTINVVLTDGSVLNTTLVIQGAAPAVDTVGNGDASSPYLIYTADQLANVATHVNSGNNTKCYKLMADIDMMGQNVEPIGTNDYPYKGIFDGNGYTISNLTISKTVKIDGSSYAIGMFGIVADSGTVANVRLSQATVTFAQSGSVSAGIIAGRSSGTIRGIYINGSKLNAESKSWMDIKNAFFDVGAVVGYNNGGVIKSVDVTAELNAKVKGLNVAGIQITGRKSLINVGAVVGYFTTESKDSEKLVSNIKVTANIKTSFDNKNEPNQNGWYGYTDLAQETIDKCIKRCKVSVND